MLGFEFGDRGDELVPGVASCHIVVVVCSDLNSVILEVGSAVVADLTMGLLREVKSHRLRFL